MEEGEKGEGVVNDGEIRRMVARKSLVGEKANVEISGRSYGRRQSYL